MYLSNSLSISLSVFRASVSVYNNVSHPHSFHVDPDPVKKLKADPKAVRIQADLNMVLETGSSETKTIEA
jgi:hypothetical protein